MRFVIPPPTTVALNAVVRLAEPATDEFPVYAKSDPPAAIGPLPRESNPARTCAGDGAGNA